MKVEIIEGNVFKLDAGSMFGHAPRTMWERWTEVDGQGRMELAARSLLITAGDAVVLTDLGCGAFMDPGMAERFGIEGTTNVLLDNLLNAGVTPDQVTHVVPSHLHFDHVGGLLPDWPGTDDPKWELTCSEKVAFLDRAVVDNWRVVFPHDPRVAAAKIVKDDEGRFQAIDA